MGLERAGQSIEFCKAFHRIYNLFATYESAILQLWGSHSIGPNTKLALELLSGDIFA